MNKTILTIFATALLASSCSTAVQKKDKADAAAAVASAEAAVDAARLAGGEAAAPSEMRSVDSDLRLAREKLKIGDWSEAGRYARLAASLAGDVSAEAAARKRSAAKSSSIKPAPARKKARSPEAK